MRRTEFPAAAYDRWRTEEPPEGRGPDEDEEPDPDDENLVAKAVDAERRTVARMLRDLDALR